MKQTRMKRTERMKRFLALMLCFLMVFSAIPTAALAAETDGNTSAEGKAARSGDDAMTTEVSKPQYNFSCNISDYYFWEKGGANNKSTEKPVLRLDGMDAANSDFTIDTSEIQTFSISNYGSIKEKFPLDYIEIDGKKLTYSDYEQAGSTWTTVKLADGECPNLNGRVIKINFNGKAINTQLVKDTAVSITNSIDAKIVFKTAAQTKYTLAVTAGANGSLVSEPEYLETDADGKSVYKVIAKPDMNYQLSSYTVKGEEGSVALDLTAENYRWVEEDNFFRIAIAKDTEITLNFTPVTVQMEFWSHVTGNSPADS